MKKTIAIAILVFINLVLLFLVYDSFVKFEKNRKIDVSKIGPTKTPPPFFEKAELVLEKGKEKNVPGTEVFLILVNPLLSESNCYDCPASTVLQARKREKIEEFSFKCGGITGECTELLEIFGYKVRLLEIVNENSIIVRVEK